MAIINISKKEVIHYLSNLCETELMEVFYEAVSAQKRINNGDVDDAYCITNSGFYPSDGEQSTELLALPKNWEGFNKTTSKEALFSGQCCRCKALVACVEVEAICPICGTTVGCN